MKHSWCLSLFSFLFSLLLSILWLAGSWILLQECKHPTSFFKISCDNITISCDNNLLSNYFIHNQKSEFAKKFSVHMLCYDCHLHWWLSPKASRSQSSANRELPISRRDDPCFDHKVDPDLHELKGPDGSEEVLLWLVARHILLQRLWALSELKISKYRILIQRWSFGIILVFEAIPHEQQSQSSDICCQGYPSRTWRYLPT